MLILSVAFQLLEPHGSQLVEYPFIGGGSNLLHSLTELPDDCPGEAAVKFWVGFESIKLLVAESYFHFGSVVCLTLRYIHSKALIPAKAGIQRRKPESRGQAWNDNM